MQGLDQLKIKQDAPLRHRMRAAHCDSQRIDPGCPYEGLRFLGTGAGARGMDPVLAADLTKLSLDIKSAVMACLNDCRSRDHVLFICHCGCIEHHRAEAQGDGLLDQLLFGGVVEVNDDRNGGVASQGKGGQADRRERSVVANSVLGDLQHDGRPGVLGCCDICLGVLNAEDIEGAQAFTGSSRRAQCICEPRQSH